MATNELDELLNETRRRQRIKTDLSDFSDRLREMMRLNISLPVMLEWLETQKKTTTLPALRRYVRRVFGDAHYEDFVRRNGWLKTKKSKVKGSEHDLSNVAPGLLGVEPSGEKGTEIDQSEVVPSSEFVRPAGITNAAWNEMQVKNAKKNRK